MQTNSFFWRHMNSHFDLINHAFHSIISNFQELFMRNLVNCFYATYESRNLGVPIFQLHSYFAKFLVLLMVSQFSLSLITFPVHLFKHSKMNQIFSYFLLSLKHVVTCYVPRLRLNKFL